MPTSTTEVIQLISQGSELYDFYTAERQALAAARANLPGLIARTVYVDEVNGLAGNDGTVTQPYRSIDDAIASCHNGQTMSIRLLSNCTWSERTLKVSSFFQVQGWNAQTDDVQRRTVTMADAATNEPGSVPGIATFGISGIYFSSIDLFLADSGSAVGHFRTNGFLSVSLLSVSINGASGSTPFIDPLSGSFALGVSSLVATGMQGRWIKNFAAGVALTADACGGIIDPAITN